MAFEFGPSFREWRKRRSRHFARYCRWEYVLGFVVLRDVVKVFPVSSSSFARKTTGGIENEVTRLHDAA